MEILKKLNMPKVQNLAAKGCIALAFVCGILAIGKAAHLVTEGFKVRAQITSAFEASAEGKTAMEAYKKQVADAMKKATQKNLLAGEVQKPSPPQFAGIMGDEVLFNGQWLKVGAEVSGAKILQIDPTFVTVQFGDKQMNIVPEARMDPNMRMAGPGGMTGGRGGPGGDMSRRGGEFGGPGGDRGSRGGRGGFGGGGFGGFMNMSQEERDSMRERFMNMSPDERRAYFQQMRENMGRGQ